jgi:flagellar protein FlgJ
LKLDNALLDKENSTKRAMPTGKLSEPVIASPDDFVQQLWPMAEKAGSSLGVDPKVILAQAALETGWGRSVIRDTNGDSSFNLFNIKSGSDWHGDAIVKNSLEFSDGVGKQERSAFRRYGSYQESFNDYVQFLQSKSRYEKALKQGDSNENYVRELQQAGYATDPDYAAKIELIMNRTQFNTTIDRQISSNGSDNILS